MAESQRKRRRLSNRASSPVSGNDLFSPPTANGDDAPGDTHGTTIRTSDVTSPQRPSDVSDRGSSPHTERLFSSPPHAMPTSEMDMMSSPLQYGTPSSRVGTPGSRMGTPGRHTPVRPRHDVRSERRMRQVNVAPSDPPTDPTSVTSSEAQPQVHLVIWGTDVNVQETKEKFKDFLKYFMDESEQAGEEEPMGGVEPFYMVRLDEGRGAHSHYYNVFEMQQYGAVLQLGMGGNDFLAYAVMVNTLEEPFLSVNCDHLRQYNQELYGQLVRYPQEVIPTFDMATNELFQQLYPDTCLEHQIQVRPYNVEKTKNMRMLNPDDIDQLITIGGMVIRLSSLVPEMREAFFECTICHSTTTVEIDRARIAEPTVCTHCNAKYTMTLVHNRSYFTDKQMVKLQESPDDMPAGQTPHTVTLYAHHDLVDSVQPGDRVIVTGIYRAMPLRVNPRQRNVKAVYKTYIDVIHYRKADYKKLRERDEEDGDGDEETVHKAFTAERREQLKQLSQMPDIYERLAHALAPSIYENEDIKKGILLQLFGGTRKDFQQSGRGSFRADVNILLCGDPGTSKSQLLQYVYSLMPRGQYTSGKGSSAVGLTAYITKDPESKQLVLQTGALVLSDNGICCIDEFDKMNDNTRAILHEVMEQQTLSLAKAGIICQLNARTSILAAANPRMSCWDPKLTTVENIQLPHTLLSRFDLIFLMLDPQDEQFDRRLARHLVSLYHQSQQDEEEEELGLEVLRDYIAFARMYIHPKLSEEAGQALVQAYVDMRKLGSEGATKSTVTAYPRQLESLIRLSEAHAKMRLSSEVEIADVEEAKRLHREALKQAATDPKTGIIDISILTTGVSSSERMRRQALAKELRKMLQSKSRAASTIKHDALFEEIRAQSQVGVTLLQFNEALRILQDEEFLTVSGQNIRVN